MRIRIYIKLLFGPILYAFITLRSTAIRFPRIDEAAPGMRSNELVVQPGAER